jgi:6-phospho-3-hexuloisomerase
MSFPVSAALLTIGDEMSAVVSAMTIEDQSALAAAQDRIAEADRIFVLGAGRSGLALSMVGMRLMHLGLDVHIVGDATTPAIQQRDVLLVASGSGSTAGIVRNAEAARAAGASIVAITTHAESPLALLSSVVIVIPAAQKRDHSAQVSAQYAGSLFEQALLVLGDALFHASWVNSSRSAEQLWPRHANLE